MADKKGKSQRLRIFDFQREGPGISKSAADMGTGLKRFFVSFKDNFDKIIYVNIFMGGGVICCISVCCKLEQC